jgi:hypothetical protein
MRERWAERDAPTSHLRAPEPAEVVAARDRADDLLQGEMRLNANEGAIGTQDRRNQGKRDSR